MKRNCVVTAVGCSLFYAWRAFSLDHQGKHVEAAAQYLKVVEKCNQQPSIDQAALVDAAHSGLVLLADTVSVCIQNGGSSPLPVGHVLYLRFFRMHVCVCEPTLILQALNFHSERAEQSATPPVEVILYLPCQVLDVCACDPRVSLRPPLAAASALLCVR